MNYRDTIFIHIPRTGGTSIKWALNNRIQDLEYINNHFHATAAYRRSLLGHERWLACYRFTIIRNPWDRAVSMYCHSGARGSFGQWLMDTDTDQTHYFMDGNDVLVTDVFKYESLDLDVLCQRASWPPLERHRVNESQHEHYGRYFTPELIDVIYRRHAEFIKRYQYEFEGKIFP